MNHTAQKVSQMCHKSMGRGFGFPWGFGYVNITCLLKNIIFKEVMKLLAIVALASLTLMNLGLAKKYRVQIIGTINSNGYELATNGAVVDNDSFELEFLIDDSSIYQESGVWNVLFPNAITDLSFSLSENALGDYSGGASANESLYANNSNSSPLVAFFDTDNGGFPPMNGIPFVEMSMDGIFFSTINLNNLTNGKTLSEINNNVDLKTAMSWSEEGSVALIFQDNSQELYISGTFSSDNVIVTDYIELPSIILNTYKSNDMQNWELIESKEIQSDEDVLFLKSEIVTQ